MEKDISIYARYLGDNRIHHISLWSDSTMNKENDFLKPIIRFAHWERQNDLDKSRDKIEITWPDIRIFLGYIKPEKFEELNSELIKLQQLIPKIHFASLGISLKRDVAELQRSDVSVEYEIWIRNGTQSLRYYSPLIENNVFLEKAIELKQLLLASMDEIDLTGWKERYDSPLDTSSFDWDYNKINAL
ncbi:MAG: hypothetical protein HOP30_15120 [Cyclobacteriaceae bacterium]|nr:hypothetical protein [Cyclobacteriaceae bacterium]